MKKLLRRFLLWVLDMTKDEIRALPAPPVPETPDPLSEEVILDNAVLDSEWKAFMFERRWEILARWDKNGRQVECPDGNLWEPKFCYPKGAFVGEHKEQLFQSKFPPIDGAVMCREFQEGTKEESHWSSYKSRWYSEFRQMYPDVDLIRILQKRIDAREHYMACRAAAEQAAQEIACAS